MADGLAHADRFIYPHEADEGPEPPGWRGSRRWLRRMLAGLGVLALIAAGVGGYAYWKLSGVVAEFSAGPKEAVVRAVLPQLRRPPKHRANLPGLDDAMTILLIGADRRYGESGGGRSDTIMLVRVDRARKTVSMLSLPRDLRVPIPGYGMDKINASYTDGGPALLIHTIKDYTGVNIQHFVQVDMAGFTTVVNDLGGVYLPIDGRYDHQSGATASEDWSSIDLQPGYQQLGGADALTWVRFRHLDSDFYRTARQQIFLREVGRQLRADIGDVGNVPKLLGVVQDIAAATTSDLHSVSAVLNLANTLRQVAPERIFRTTVDADALVLGGVDYEQASPAQLHAALERWSNPHAAAARPEGRSTWPSAQSGQIQSTPAAAAGPLVADGGTGRALLSAEHGLAVCAPTALPAGYAWPSSGDSPARSYDLAGHPALAAWASAGSGTSILWMWTTWQQPPILAAPTNTLRIAGQSYSLYEENGGKLRMVAWRIGATRACVTNTLRDDLTRPQMLALATSCQAL
jgi:LCP family protein required for cell wall assembly